jgi:hypothetical protein
VSRGRETDTEVGEAPRPTRAQRLVAAAFLAAFGLTIITVLLTGLWVRSPGARHAAERATPFAAPPRPAAGAPIPAAAPSPAETRGAEIVPAVTGNGDDAGENPTHAEKAGEPSTSAAR